jgi:hypothetical protein
LAVAVELLLCSHCISIPCAGYAPKRDVVPCPERSLDATLALNGPQDKIAVAVRCTNSDLADVETMLLVLDPSKSAPLTSEHCTYDDPPTQRCTPPSNCGGSHALNGGLEDDYHHLYTYCICHVKLRGMSLSPRMQETLNSHLIRALHCQKPSAQTRRRLQTPYSSSVAILYHCSRQQLRGTEEKVSDLRSFISVQSPRFQYKCPVRTTDYATRSLIMRLSLT